MLEQPEAPNASPPATRAPGWRRAAYAGLAALLGVLGSLGVVEVVFRVWGIRPLRLPPPRYLAFVDGDYRDFRNKWGMEKRPGRPRFHIKQPSRVRGGVEMGEYVPGARFRMVYASNPRGYFDDDGGVAATINSLGMRGPEVAAEKPPGTFRILGVGDSFTFGAGVRDADTYLAQLEQRLDRPDRQPRYQVLNAGVEGYNTRDEVLSLEQRWLELAPDLVIIGFYLNDAYSDSAFRNMGEAQGINLGRPDGLARYSYLWDFIQHRRRVQAARRAVDRHYRRHYFVEPEAYVGRHEREVSWTQCRQALARAATLARERNIKLAMVVFPEFHELDGDYPFQRIHDLVVKTGRELGIPTLDLLPVFRGHDARGLWVHITDHHPNEIAHRRAADELAAFLRAEGLLS